MTKTLLITQKACGGCAAVKKALKDELSSGEIEEVPIETERGEKIADELGLDMVPECVYDDDGRYSKCDLERLLDKKKI
jgi:hypothetical protein